MVQDDGPYLLAALLCERAYQNEYGAFNIDGVIEELVVQANVPRAPKDMPPFRLEGFAVIAFAAGVARGAYRVTLVPIRPNGERLEPVSQQISFDSDESRYTAVYNLSLDVTEPGLYWFDVLLNERLVSRIPVRIRYNRNVLQLLNAM